MQYPAFHRGIEMQILVSRIPQTNVAEEPPPFRKSHHAAQTSHHGTASYGFYVFTGH